MWVHTMVHSFPKAFTIRLLTELGVSQDAVSITLETRVATLGFIKITHQRRWQYTYTCIRADLVPRPLDASLTPTAISGYVWHYSFTSEDV